MRSEYSLRYIGEIYNVSKTTISNINHGKIYRHSDIDYPIHKAKNSVSRLETSEIKKIIHLLLTTELSYTKIGEQLDIGRKTVSNIDQGKGYVPIVQQLGYTSFPIRKK